MAILPKTKKKKVVSQPLPNVTNAPNVSNVASNVASREEAARRLKKERERDIYRLPSNLKTSNLKSPLNLPSYTPPPSLAETAYKKRQQEKFVQKRHQRRVFQVTGLCMGFTLVAVGYIAPKVHYSRLMQQAEFNQKEIQVLNRETVHLNQEERRMQRIADQAAKNTLHMELTPATPDRQRILSVSK